MSISYPDPPWTLRGQALAVPLLIPRERVATPAPIAPLSVAGRVPGLLVAARYGAGSVLEYHELAVLAAVRSGGRPSALVLGLWVDDPTSRAGGRAIWALDKRLAAFAWSRSDHHVSVEIRQGPTTLLRARYRPLGRASWPAPPIRLRTLVVRDGRVEAFMTRVHGRVRPVRLDRRAAVPFPPHPPHVDAISDGRAAPFARADAAPGSSPGHVPVDAPDTSAGPPVLTARLGLVFEPVHIRVDAPRPI